MSAHPSGHEPRTGCARPISAAEVRLVLEAGRYDLTDEYAAQAGIEADMVAVFGAEAVSREHRLGAADRPDFLVAGTIVVEVKHFRSRPASTLRQLARYAAYPEVKAIILATGRAMNCPTLLNGVEVFQIRLGQGWL